MKSSAKPRTLVLLLLLLVLAIPSALILQRWNGSAVDEGQLASSMIVSAPARPVLEGEPALSRVKVIEVPFAPSGDGAAPQRVLCSFLDGRPVQSVLHFPALPRQPGLAFADRPRATRHIVGDSNGIMAGVESVALCCEGTQVCVVSLRGLAPGETRVDLTPSRKLRVQLVNVPPGLQDKVDLEVLVGFAFDESAEERSAVIAMSCGVFPVRLQGANFCDVPMLLSRAGEVTVVARARGGGAAFTAKQDFLATDDVVHVDVSPLKFCASLVSLALSLEYPYAYPDGAMRIALLDVDGVCVGHHLLVRRGEPVLNTAFLGVRPGSYTPEIQLEDHHAIRLAEVHAGLSNNPISVSVVANSRVDLFVVCADKNALAACGVLVFDGVGRMVGGGARRGERSELFHLKHLPAGSYFVQVLAEQHQMASAVVNVVLGEAETQQISVSLERAGCLLVRSDPAADQTPFVDLISSQGTASRFFLYKTERRAWCPAGPYTVRTADSSHPVDIPSGMTIPFMLR